MKKYLVAIVILILLLLVFRTLNSSGFFKTIENHSELKNESIIRGIPGPEDFDIDIEFGYLFISSTDRWGVIKGNKSDDGIYLLDLNKQDSPKQITTTYVGEFHPHGISYFKTDKGDFLYVVNHNKKGNYIELFRFDNDTLFHVKTFENDLMFSPNDIVAIDTNKFYVTNDHGNKKGFMRTMEEYLMLPQSYILYYNGESYSIVYDGLNYANGINVSNSGDIVYVSETIGRRISVLDRDRKTGELKLRFSKNIDTGLDNISIDSEGDLWIASHPKMLDFVGHAKSKENISPSQVLKLRHRGEDDFEIMEVYLNDGAQLSGSSVALHYKNKIFIGVVFEDKVLVGGY